MSNLGATPTQPVAGLPGGELFRGFSSITNRVSPISSLRIDGKLITATGDGSIARWWNRWSRTRESHIWRQELPSRPKGLYHHSSRRSIDGSLLGLDASVTRYGRLPPLRPTRRSNSPSSRRRSFATDVRRSDRFCRRWRILCRIYESRRIRCEVHCRGGRHDGEWSGSGCGWCGEEDHVWKYGDSLAGRFLEISWCSRQISLVPLFLSLSR